MRKKNKQEQNTSSQPLIISNASNVVSLNDAQQTRVLCVMLVLHAIVSFRAVPRILELFSQNSNTWIPHFTSVINWTLRVGLAMLNQVATITAPWIALIDTSINVGTQKALVVLRVKLDALTARGSALRLEDCECIGLRVMEQVNGETISSCLTEIFKQAGDPIAILKDQGSDLARGVTLWKESEKKQKVEVIDDIGHSIANGLKAQFKKLKTFKKFLKILRKGAARLRQTPWAFLTPPKIRTKGRFQSIGKLADWGGKILSKLDQEDKKGEGSASAALRKAMPGFSKFRTFIKQFAQTSQIVHDVLKLLKQEGLNENTYRACKVQAETLPVRSKVRKRLLGWLDKHIAVRRVIQRRRLEKGEVNLPVSTDILESLFGKYKQVLERSPIADMNRMALIIPAFCGPELNGMQLSQLFSTTQHQDIGQWEQSNIAYTVHKKRRLFLNQFREVTVPKTGKAL